jgi:hypothetical protein
MKARSSSYSGQGESRTDLNRDRDLITMSWRNTQEYTPDEARDFIKSIKRHSRGFTPLTTAKFRIMRKEIAPKWTDDQIISSWHLLATQRSLKNHRHVFEIPLETLRDLSAENLLKVSQQYQAPPLAVVYRALLAKGCIKSVADKWTKTPNLVTDPQLHALIIKGWENDSENPTTFKMLFQKSREYELEVERLLRRTDIQFKTQENLVKEQTELYGRPIITPDFLFLEPVMVIVTHPDGSVTDHRVNWIDVKNYMFMGADFITRSLKEQASKYVKEFGEGAFLFHYGFVNSISIPGTIMLASSAPFQGEIKRKPTPSPHKEEAQRK